MDRVITCPEFFITQIFLADNLFKLNFVPLAHSNQVSLQHRASSILSREEKMAEEIEPTIEFFALTTSSGDSDPYPRHGSSLLPDDPEMRRKG